MTFDPGSWRVRCVLAGAIDASHEQAAAAVLVTELEAFLDVRAGTGTDWARAELALRVLKPDPAGTS